MELDHKSDFHVTTQLHLGVNCSGHLLNLLDPFLLHHLDRGQDVLFKGFKGKGRPKKTLILWQIYGHCFELCHFILKLFCLDAWISTKSESNLYKICDGLQVMLLKPFSKGQNSRKTFLSSGVSASQILKHSTQP